MNNLERIQKLVDQGAIFYVSHSAGKDSQAMYLVLFNLIPVDQIVVVHADLGEVEWRGVIEHIEDTVAHDVNVVRAQKSLFDMVDTRFEKRPEVPSWPSSAHRQCTSDLKRDPIYKFIRNDLKARGKYLAVNCMGLRAQESSARAKKVPYQVNNRLSNQSRTVYDWLPIFDLTTEEVFDTIHQAGQEAHWAYSEGNERLSCVFCIMGSANDFRNGAKHNPELLAKYAEYERKTGYTMFQTTDIIARAS